MSSERRTAEPRRLDQVGHVPRASRRSLKYGEPRPRIDEPATLRSEVRGAREPRPFTGSAELFRRRATRADIDRGCTTTVVLPEGSTGSCTRPGVSRDPTQSSSTSSSRGHRKSDVARPRRGGVQRGRIARRGQCCATPCCRARNRGPYTVTVYLGTGRGAAAPQARADTANRGRGLEATPFDAQLASIDPQGRTAHHHAGHLRMHLR